MQGMTAMLCFPDTASLLLPRGGVIRLTDAAGTRVTCRSGAAWITLDDDRRDIVLEAGDQFVIDRAGLTLVCALAGPAAIEVTEPRPDGGLPLAAGTGEAAEASARKAA